MRGKTTLFYGLAALLAGCVPVFSLHPLASQENLTFDEALIGVWDDDGGTTWQFSRATTVDVNALPDDLDQAGGKLYRLEFHDKDQRTGIFLACLVKLGDSRFLDVFPQAFPSGRTDIETTALPYNGLFFVRAHTFICVDEIGEQVKMRRTDDETFKKLVAADPSAIAFTKADDRYLITASTDAIEAFVSKHAGDDLLFTSDITLTRQKQD